MPVNVIVDDCPERERVYVLDPGNSRIKCLTLGGKFLQHLSKESSSTERSNRLSFLATDSLLESTSTGLAYRSSTATFYLLDWKSKLITEFSLGSSHPSSIDHGQTRIHHQVTCSLFNEPVQIALFPQHLNALLICDNNMLFIIDHRTGDLITKIDPRLFGIKSIKAFTIGLHDEIMVGEHRVHVFSYEGKYLRQIASINQQQTVDVDVHIAHQPPDLIASHHRQQPVSIFHQSKSSHLHASKGGQWTELLVDKDHITSLSQDSTRPFAWIRVVFFSLENARKTAMPTSKSTISKIVCYVLSILIRNVYDDRAR